MTSINDSTTYQGFCSSICYLILIEFIFQFIKEFFIFDFNESFIFRSFITLVEYHCVVVLVAYVAFVLG